LWYANYENDGHVNPSVSFGDFTSFGGFLNPDQKQTAGNQTVPLCNNKAWHAYIDFNYQNEWKL
jgi:hypothetical protein